MSGKPKKTWPRWKSLLSMVLTRAWLVPPAASLPRTSKRKRAEFHGSGGYAKGVGDSTVLVVMLVRAKVWKFCTSGNPGSTRPLIKPEIALPSGPCRVALNWPALPAGAISATNWPAALKDPLRVALTRAVGGMNGSHLRDFGSTLSTTVKPLASSTRTRNDWVWPGRSSTS